MMGLNDIANYIFYDNPISKYTLNITKNALNASAYDYLCKTGIDFISFRNCIQPHSQM